MFFSDNSVEFCSEFIWSWDLLYGKLVFAAWSSLLFAFSSWFDFWYAI